MCDKRTDLGVSWRYHPWNPPPVGDTEDLMKDRPVSSEEDDSEKPASSSGFAAAAAVTDPLGEAFIPPSYPSPSTAPAEIDLDLLKDTEGNRRGALISLEGSEREVLKMLYDVYGECEKHLGQVQRYTQHLYHYAFNSPGFPHVSGLDGYQFFASFSNRHVAAMESLITEKVRDALAEIGYCANDQDVQLHLSFLKTRDETDVQPPHIDHQWPNVVPPENFPNQRPPRSFRGNYREWAPFVALFPLTEDGMTVEVWHARDRHDVPQRPDHRTGQIVRLSLGHILLLRGDVVHAGGFCTSDSGNPRGHFYVYKTPRGAPHPYPLSNCYHTPAESSSSSRDGVVPLLKYYKHHPDCAGTSSVEFQSNNT